jgi:hypothetical protein
MACISYELLTGKHPYRGKNALEARAARLSPRRPAGLAQRQWRTLREGLQLRRELRPDDMQAWIERLHLMEDPARLPPLPAVMTPRTPHRTSSGWMVCGVIALIAAVFWLAFDDSDAVRHAEAGISATAAGLMQDMHNATAKTAARTAAAPPVHSSGGVPPRPAPPPAAHAVLQSPPQTAKAAAPPVSPETVAPADHPRVARLEMATDALDVSPVTAVATVIVRRKDSYRDNVSFTWSTESGTARSGEDFVPVNSRVEYMSGRDHEARMLIPIVADPRRHVAKSFYVVLDDASDGAKVGARQITMVTIPASD